MNRQALSFAVLLACASSASAAELSRAASATGDVATRGLTPRSVDVFHVRDYGALGNGTAAASQTLGSVGSPVAQCIKSLAMLAACNPKGVATPYTWVSNPAYGLTFVMKTAKNSSGSANINFLSNLFVAPNYQGVYPQWQSGRSANALVTPGMLISGCGIAAGTTIAPGGVGNTPGTGDYGTITLSSGQAGPCPAGSLITFTIAPAQLAALTQDWLGIQSAAAHADMKGGEVYIPSGTYRLNHAIMHKGMSAGPVDLPAAVPGAYGTPGGFVTYRGEGASTILVETVDLGAHQCAFGVASRAYYVNDNTAAGYRDPADFATYRDFALYGGNNGAIGKRNLGEIPTENDGICISGGGTLVSNVLVQHFHAGVNISGDHLTIEGLTTGFDGYGIYTEPYNASGGGFFIRNSNFSGNYIAGVGEASTGGIDSSQLLNVYMGYQPFAFYMERTPANLSSAYNSGYQSGQSYDLLSNSTLRDVYSEAHGNGIIYDANGAGQVVNNSITGGSVWSMGLGVGSGSYWSGAPKKAMISVGQFAGNTMIATQWGTNSGYVTDATISAYSVSSNVWLGDVGFVTSGTAKIPAIVSGSPPMGNTFVGSSPGAGPSYRGYFGYIGGTIASAGLPLSYNAENYVVPYIAGHGFAGVSLTPAAASSAGGFVAVAVATEGNNVKVVPSPTLSPQLPAHRFVYPTSDGFAEAMSSAHAVGYSGYGLNAGAVEIALNPLLDKGENGSANDLTASGGATFTGSVAGNTLRLTAGPYTGALAVGQAIAGLNVAPGTMISGKDGADWHVTPAQNVANGGLTSGYAIENNINEFTKVAPGAIAVLNTYTPIGTSELICNDDTSNSLVVYPAPGATFVGAMLNATIAANTCQSFTKIGAGRWN